MDRGSSLATSFGRPDLCEQWSTCASAIQHDICTRGMDPTGTHFTSVYGEVRPDASLLQLSLHGFLPDADPRLVATVRWVRETLGAGEFLYRYRDDDGVAGAEGAFVLCGFWLAEALALQGDVDEAHGVFAAHAAATNHVDLLAEEVDPKDGSALGNFPQAFSHLGLINAAMRLDLALRLRDEGSSRGPHLVGRGARRQ
jgi:GH15 family glucan-1,4-alpha-glucosidase